MRSYFIMGLALTSVVTLFPLSSSAEYLLNCRLMDHRSPNFKRWCSSESDHVLSQCTAQGLCVPECRIFGSVYSNGVVASQTGAVKGGIASGVAVSSVAISSTVGNVANTASSTLSGASNAGGTLSGTVGSLSNSAHNTLSGATNAVGGLIK